MNKNSELDDLALIENVKRRDIGAFERLYRKHVGRVYALAIRMTEDTGRAEELTQDIFVRVWQKIPLFKGASGFPTWLYRLSMNLIINEQRGRSRHRRKEIPIPENMTSRAEKTGIETSLDLEKAVAALPQGAKAVFVLFDIEGFPHEEIARIRNISVGTSKAHLHRARKMLREALGYEM
jgi:RNA polymerase sigma-70 factor (ECF subfamily)